MNLRRSLRNWGKKAIDFVMGEPFYPVADMPRSIAELTSGPGQGLDSNVIMSPLLFIMRNFTEAEAVVERRTESVWERVEDHPVQQLLDEPNSFYDGDVLSKGIVLSYCMDGNAYIQKVRNGIGEVIQLWYIPHWLIRPKWDERGTSFIDYYEYNPTGREPVRLAPRDVIHHRFGVDPRNTRLGISTLKILLQEIMADDEAARFATYILANHGVPGLLLSPGDPGKVWTDKQATDLKQQMNDSFTREKRGSTMVMAQNTKVDQFGFDPNKLTLANLRDISEERVCAALGLPAAVVGFGSGLQSTKVGATMRELIKLTWVSCLSPMQTTLARQLTRQLLRDFVSQTRRFRVRFDTSDVSGFQEDEDQKSNRVLDQMSRGALRVDRAQKALGLEVDDNMKVYYRPANVIVVDEDGEDVTPPKPTTPGIGDDQIPTSVQARMGANGNGNGTNPEEE